MNDDARAGYDAAIRLTDKLARTAWSVYSGLVATNAFLVALAVFVSTGRDHGAFVKVLGILGLLICLAWYLITMRNFDYYGYFFAWAREFEREAFGDAVPMIRRGEEFSRGGGAQIGDATRRMRWGSRLFKVEWLVNAVIFGFAVIYTFLAFSG